MALKKWNLGKFPHDSIAGEFIRQDSNDLLAKLNSPSVKVE
jgi:hypothetical protein